MNNSDEIIKILDDSMISLDDLNTHIHKLLEKGSLLKASKNLSLKEEARLNASLAYYLNSLYYSNVF